MLEPIINDTIIIETEQFTADQVTNFKTHPDGTTKHPSRHYSQSIVSFDEKIIARALNKFSIPLDVRILIFGGYTGEFSVFLRNMGMTVIFTDPMNEWVDNAHRLGFSAHEYSAETIPGELINDSDLVASFECYIPFNNLNNEIYTTLRFLTTKYGILFCESNRTIEEIKKELIGSKLKRMKSAFTSFTSVYGVEVKFVNAGDCRLYHVYAPTEDVRKKIIVDCMIAQLLYDQLENKMVIDNDVVDRLSSKTKKPQDVILTSIMRLYRVYRLKVMAIGPIAQYVPIEDFSLGDKLFKINNRDITI